MTNKTVEFIWHSRALRALGPELVTNDLVAILELVKNSYDAGAKKVDVIFEYSTSDKELLKGEYKNPNKIIISDNGSGMSEKDIETKWFVIGTPNKEEDSTIDIDGKSRAVSGSKGIGRLAAARLGNKLRIITKAQEHEATEFTINWNLLFSSDKLPGISLKDSPKDAIIEKGTIIEIEEINKEWTEFEINEISDGLSRLISPFKPRTDFEIEIKVINQNNIEKVFSVNYQDFLDKPVYKISGVIDFEGNIHGDYEYLPLGFNVIQRTKTINKSWKKILDDELKNDKSFEKKGFGTTATCGEFTFEIRCWDINSKSTDTIKNLYNLTRSDVRKYIKYYKGLSVYRDDVLVMPKDESNRDWLGLDLKRVSRVGDRISTNQIVGCINISNKENSKLNDASDREGLANNKEVEEFKLLLLHIIQLLQIERSFDKVEPIPSITDLFTDLNADLLLEELEPFVKSGQLSLPAMNLITKFADELEIKRKNIETHFRYYGQLATLGQISGLLLHEVRNGLMPMGVLIDELKNSTIVFSHEISSDIISSEKSVNRLEEVADRFAPLANRNRPKFTKTNIKEAIDSSLLFLQRDFSDKKISKVYNKHQEIFARINQAELELVLINLLLNSIYWVCVENKENDRSIAIEVNVKNSIVEIAIIDNGPGVPEEEIIKIFEPGVTRKPNGIGMGLPISVYFLDRYDGKLFYESNDVSRGAKFIIQLHIWEKQK